MIFLRVLTAACLLTGLCFAARPVIFDTDMGNDVDDALALAMLHALTDRGECNLIGVTLTNANPAAVPYIRMLNRFYGRADLPVGAAIRDLKGGNGDGYMSVALHEMPTIANAPAPQAPDLIRNLLTAATEKVTIVQTGFSTNLAALLDSAEDLALIRDKVSQLVVMAGNFGDGAAEYNVRIDPAAAKAVFERWPGPVIFSGFEIGRELLFPAAEIDRDFLWGEPNPVAVSYRAYKKMPYDRPAWDLTAVLEAVRPDRGYFGLSENGAVTVDSRGVTSFTSGGGSRQYLKLDPSARGWIMDVLELLSSEPPTRGRLSK